MSKPHLVEITATNGQRLLLNPAHVVELWQGKDAVVICTVRGSHRVQPEAGDTDPLAAVARRIGMEPPTAPGADWQDLYPEADE